jgi:CBS domain-containing protein
VRGVTEHGLKLVAETAAGPYGASALSAFHLVNNLVPDRQDLVVVPPETSVREAVELMGQHDFSQVPVVAGVEVLGLFSYRSLGRRLNRVRKPQALLDLEVDEFVDDAVFVRVTDDLQVLLPHLDRDGAVLIGGPDNLLAVVTPTDVTDYLFRVTRPFVLLEEIELVLRSLVMSRCEAGRVADRISAAVAHEYENRKQMIPVTLERLSLSQLIAVVLNRTNYDDVFAAVFGRNRDSSREHLEPIGDLRNAILHFRRRATATDLDHLRSTRAWLLRKARRLSGRERA